MCECTPRPEITEAIVADAPPSGGGLLQYSDAHTVELSFTMPRTDDGNRTNVSFYRVLVYDVADSDVPPPSPPSPRSRRTRRRRPEAAVAAAAARAVALAGSLRSSPPPLPAPSPPPTAWWILHRQQRQQAGRSALVEPQADVTAAPAATVSTWAEALQKQQLLEREAAAEAKIAAAKVKLRAAPPPPTPEGLTGARCSLEAAAAAVAAGAAVTSA